MPRSEIPVVKVLNNFTTGQAAKGHKSQIKLINCGFKKSQHAP